MVESRRAGINRFVGAIPDSARVESRRAGINRRVAAIPDSSMVESRRVGINRRVAAIPDSSMVEQPAVNRFVVGSSPTRGAFLIDLQRFATRLNSCRFQGLQ